MTTEMTERERRLGNSLILAERHIKSQEERILKRNQTIRAQKKEITELKGDLTRLRINNMGLVERCNQFADEKQELRGELERQQRDFEQREFDTRAYFEELLAEARSY